ncbi:ABC transporter permease [Bhargavaea beijingensis]|uniref:ABC transporter permease n=1 Tax=Bhargavaea beijingensis TaxID=426756 RepID=UPI002225A168|nr:ABC transporter permease [Bhargavaea beijingensis]MCW1927918.1 ABC transporter permease [Bhargavaea beijingensis]
MFKLAMKLMLSRRKWLIVIICSFALMLAATFSILMASETIKSNLKKAAYQNYGEHTGVILGAEALKEDVRKNADSVGEFALSDRLILKNGKVVSVGWFDEEALRLSHIRLSEGTFPSKANEIVIESSYKKLLDKQDGQVWKIGESKLLEFESGHEQVTLAGVIEDYSANWSVPAGVEKGKDDFPNILTLKPEITPYQTHNYMFQIKANKYTALDQSSSLISDYGEGFINSRLLHTGLIDYGTVSTVAFAFQIVVICLSIISILTLLSFYFANTVKKIGIFKAVGANTRNIFSIISYQYLIMLSAGILLAVPMSIPLTTLIVENTYDNGKPNDLNWAYIIGLNLVMILIISLCVVLKTIQDVRKVHASSVASSMRSNTQQLDISKLRTEKFILKQLYMQVVTYKKWSILTVLSLSLCMLVITLSIFIQKETAGIWGSDVDYYISAQELFQSKTIGHLEVLKEEGLTISANDVNRIESLPFVSNVEKTPFMVDVHPLIEEEFIPQSLGNWISSLDPEEGAYKDKRIIPHANYQVVDAKGFEELYGKRSFEEFQGKVLLLLPSGIHGENLKGHEMQFVRKYNSGSGLKTQEWTYPIHDVMDASEVGREDLAFTVILDEETAIKNGIFRGYYNLSISTKDYLSEKQTDELESILSEIVSTTPGSLYQKISDFEIEDTKISFFFGFLGKLSYSTAILLAVISTITMIFGKYNNQKLRWGTYMSLGMSKKRVIQYLGLELLLYLVCGSIISTLIFLSMAFWIGHVYPISLYLLYHLLSIAMISLLLLTGICLVRNQINRHSIHDLLRRDE